MLDSQAQRFQAVSAGVLALTGGVLTVTGSLLQQRAQIPRGDPTGVLHHIAGHPWFAAALVSVVGTLCWAVAFPAIGRTLRDPVGRTAARMAEPVLAVAAAVFAVTYALDGFTSGMIARQWISGERGTDALTDIRVVEGVVGGTSTLSQALLGLALSAYALAILRSGRYSRVLSWAGVAATLGWFVGGSALFLQLPGASFLLLLPFTTLATIWTMGLGIALLRHNRHSAPGAESTS
ncbi:DUF4386 family protein [Nocardiopsis baichengensis]|uniref:DUF4386 family protein n=1 Tax=Nocardiopsis baichengensis TaxID=280240 RepID=UPI000368C46B|nr:DUF4386 family protein [Nocardiopsis baichengensis]